LHYVMTEEQLTQAKFGSTPMTMTGRITVAMSQKIDSVDPQGVASSTGGVRLEWHC